MQEGNTHELGAFDTFRASSALQTDAPTRCVSRRAGSEAYVTYGVWGIAALFSSGGSAAIWPMGCRYAGKVNRRANQSWRFRGDEWLMQLSASRDGEAAFRCTRARSFTQAGLASGR